MISSPRVLPAWYRQHGHDLDGLAGKDRKVRVLLKKSGGGLVRVGTNNHESAHSIADIIDAALRDLLSLTQGTAHGDDGGMMFLDPRLPRRHAFAFLCAPIGFGKCVPGSPSRTGFAAEEHGEKGIVRTHTVSSLFCIAGWNNNLVERRKRPMLAAANLATCAKSATYAPRHPSNNELQALTLVTTKHVPRNRQWSALRHELFSGTRPAAYTPPPFQLAAS